LAIPAGAGYGSVIDQAGATGVDPGSLRVINAARKASTVALMVIGALVFVVVLAFVLSVWFGG
jgi:hypothetical protein